jgi:tRNA-splicing ligase RtcB (3'-phosphate/5'-hydroxy nucleic acid ligase)
MKRLSLKEIEQLSSEEVYFDNKKNKPIVKNIKNIDLPLIKTTKLGNTIKVWTSNLDSAALRQAVEFADLPFIYPKGLALMPDVHVGMGVPVGSVIPTTGALVPSAVGTDIGCGMLAVRLNIKKHELPDNLRSLRLKIEELIPVGSGCIQKNDLDDQFINNTWLKLKNKFEQINQDDYLKIQSPWRHLGTLGSGNHFIEISFDEDKCVWIVIHTGSRGPGGSIGGYFINKAHKRIKENGIDAKIGWFEEADPLFSKYTDAVEWAQTFAHENRQVILEKVLFAIKSLVNFNVIINGVAINCHHNYVMKEKHFDSDMWITRKGAIRAGVGEWGIIPGSMGTETYIVKGKGNIDSYCSCSHGAGRILSRKEAKERFNVGDLKKQLSGIECKKTKGFVDEIPSAYKPIKNVILEQKDLIETVHVLKQLISVKGE